MAGIKKLPVLFALVLLMAACFPNASWAYTEIALKVGHQYAEINGGWHRLDAAPYLRNGRTMVPLRFISEALGADVQWDGELKTISISISDR